MYSVPSVPLIMYCTLGCVLLFSNLTILIAVYQASFFLGILLLFKLLIFSFQFWEPLIFFLLVFPRKSQASQHCDDQDLFSRILIILSQREPSVPKIEKENTKTKGRKDMPVESRKDIFEKIFRKQQKCNNLQIYKGKKGWFLEEI